jgi:hypothetical protein
VLGRCWQEFGKRTAIFWMCAMLGFAIMGCSQSISGQKADAPVAIAINPSPRIEEVSPPDAIQQLGLELDQYEPQLKILGLEPDETITDTTVNLRLQVKDFPIYKDAKLALGPHIHVLLDNQPYRTVYNASEALTFRDLSPGSHTVRAFAVRPWDESFKTAGASAQVAFHVYAPTQANRPDPAQPLLTYNNPQGEYGAEPIMLDYSITPPTSKTGQKPSPAPWSVNVSLNGQSFKTSEKAPIYLTGFKPGVNWLKLELLNANGKTVANAFSETVRLITFKPNGKDTLSRLVRGELTAQDAERIVNRRVSKRLEVQEKADQEEQEALATEAEAKRESAKLAVPSPEASIKTSTPSVVEPAPILVAPRSPSLKAGPAESAAKPTSPRSQPSNAPVLQSSPTPVPSLEKPSEQIDANIQPSTPKASTNQDVPLWAKLKSSLFPAKSDKALPESQPNALRSIPSEASSSIEDPKIDSEPSEPLQKLLDFQPLDPEKLPVIQQKTAVEVPSRYFKKPQPSNQAMEEPSIEGQD